MGKSIDDLTYAELLILEFERLKNLLLNKNAAYGGSVFERGILFDIDPLHAVMARINDKISRIKNRGVDDLTEDTVDDLIGYFVILQIIRKKRLVGENNEKISNG